MARFRGTVQGGRGPGASRLGNKLSGLIVQANGWDVGIRVIARVIGPDEVKLDDDIFDVYLTGGSNNARTEQLIGSFSELDFDRLEEEDIALTAEKQEEKPCDYCGNHPALTGPDSYGACENCKLGHDENFPDGGELSVGGFTELARIASDTSNQDLNVPELVTGLEASGLNVITIDEETDFSKLPSLGELLGRKEN